MKFLLFIALVILLTTGVRVSERHSSGAVSSMTGHGPPGGAYVMQDNYQSAYGYSYAWQNIPWEGTALGMASDTLVLVKETLFSLLLAYDAHHFFCQRAPFPEQWIRQPGGIGVWNDPPMPRRAHNWATICRLPCD